MVVNVWYCLIELGVSSTSCRPGLGVGLCQHPLLLLGEYTSFVKVVDLTTVKRDHQDTLAPSYAASPRTQLFAQFCSYVFFVSAHAVPSSPGFTTLAVSRHAK